MISKIADTFFVAITASWIISVGLIPILLTANLLKALFR